MPTFHYTARDTKGAETRGRLEAGSRKHALAQLRARQLTPSQLDEGAAPAAQVGEGLSLVVLGGKGVKRFGRAHARNC